MITQSGRLVMPDNGVNPSIEDIAHGLARIHRFGGQYIHPEPWTVAHHSLLCEAIARHDDASRAVRFAALTHDFHEVLTGDVTHHWKTDAVRDQQERIDYRLGLYVSDRSVRTQVKAIDDRALWAESFALHPKAFGPLLGRGEVSSSMPFDVSLMRGLIGIDARPRLIEVIRRYESVSFPFFKAVE